MKIPFVKNGEEFDLPMVSAESDVQLTIDLLKLQVRTEKETAKDLGLDVREMRKELLKHQLDKTYEISDDAKSYNNIMAIQLNLETVYHMLHKIDPLVTKDQVSGLGGTKIAEIITMMFPVMDFQKAT